MGKKRKVCFVLPNAFPVPAVCGGAIETLVENLIKMNNKYEKIDFTICTVYNKDAVKVVKEKKYKSTSFRYTYPNSTKRKICSLINWLIRKIFHKNIIRLSKHYGELEHFINTNKFDLVIAEGGDYKLLGEICNRYSKEKMVLHLHHHYRPDKFAKSYYGNVIGVSEYVTQQYRDVVGEENVHTYVLKNAIDISIFKNKKENAVKREELGFEKDDFIVLYVGRIIEVKGVKELVEAVTGIENKKIKLMIIGSPNFSERRSTDYFEIIKAKAENSNGQVKYVGYIKNDNIGEYADIANIQCVPSLWEEAAGLVVLEAMVSGLPTIITNSGGMVEFVCEKTSLIVEKDINIVENLRKEIISLYEDPLRCEKMSEEAKKHVQSYDIDEYYNNFVEIVEDICKYNEGIK